MAPATTFPRFGSLPAELRQMVWQYALAHPAPLITTISTNYGEDPGPWCGQPIQMTMHHAKPFNVVSCGGEEVAEASKRMRTCPPRTLVFSSVSEIPARLFDLFGPLDPDRTLFHLEDEGAKTIFFFYSSDHPHIKHVAINCSSCWCVLKNCVSRPTSALDPLETVIINRCDEEAEDQGPDSEMFHGVDYLVSLIEYRGAELEHVSLENCPNVRRHTLQMLDRERSPPRIHFVASGGHPAQESPFHYCPAAALDTRT